MLVSMLCAVALLSPQNQPKDTCLAYVNRNLAKGNGNWYGYYTFSRQKVTFKAGDVLSYEVFLDPKNPLPKGGIDIDFNQSDALRDRGATDQNGVRAHGDGLLPDAVGKWYLRKIPLDSVAGRISETWNLVFEGDADGRYVQFVDNVMVLHQDGTKTVIYENGPPAMRAEAFHAGYSIHPALHFADRSKVGNKQDLELLVAQTEKAAERLAQIDAIQRDVDIVAAYVKQNPTDAATAQHLLEAQQKIADLNRREEVTEDEIQATMHAVNHALSHAHPMMAKYTGHMVGHAHIDLQWLWEWQEGMVVSHDTFLQATRFMDEFPGFTFSQSSSWLYKTVEDAWPDLFKQIQAKVKKGQWELVGGRVCEGDTNMISPESHVRQFLYGQSYFKEKFGKIATVGWEPDTFGHTAQMPQILKLSGCDYYYFCRAGKNKPLFWWEALDGTKVLAFEEPATGSWYNSDVSYKQFEEMLNFEKVTGSKDMLWVYGVGNHGGGPTREHLNETVKMMANKALPNVKFSTATQFFKALEKYDLSKIPTIKDELNPVFDGCYTTHSEVKQLNREAENWTTSAEAVAATASIFGFKYPQAEFRRNWEDICYNHHHDTLPGSGHHAPYEKTKNMLRRAVEDSKEIATRALELLSVRVTPKKGGISVMVYNPTGAPQSGWISTYLVTSGWSNEALNPAECSAFSPEGKGTPVYLDDAITKKARFYATDIPAFGYKVFHIKNDDKRQAETIQQGQGLTFTSGSNSVTFDPQAGAIVSWKRGATGEFLPGSGPLGRLEMHLENPEGMSAWTLGRINSVEKLKPGSYEIAKVGGEIQVRFKYEMSSVNRPDTPTRITQTFHLMPGLKEIEATIECDWHHVGSWKTQNPMLRVAFETRMQKPIASYEVPFGSIRRPVDGKEYPALKWAAIQSGDQRTGVAVLNDSKYGFSASQEGSTLRMSMIRSSFEPDPEPNPGFHVWNYKIVPINLSTVGGVSGLEQQALAFNQPLLSATVPFDAHGSAPLTYSPITSGIPGVATSFKKSEDGKGYILRFYDASGRPSEGQIKPSFPIIASEWVNFLENKIAQTVVKDGSVETAVRPFEIKTLKLYPAKVK